MSESSFTGTIKNFSPKPDEGYYGLFIDNGNEEKWLNGQGEIPSHWSKGDKVKVKANMDNFIEIQEIDVISSSGGGGRSSNSDSGESGEGVAGGNHSNKNQSFQDKKDRQISKKVAFKEAVETVRQEKDIKLHSPEEGGEHIQLLKKTANGYLNVLNSLGDE